METPPPDPFFVESLVAAIGIEPLVSHTFSQVSQAQIDRAHKIPDEINRKLTRFCLRDEPEDTRELPDWDFEAVKEWLIGDEKPEDVQKTIAGFADTDLGMAVVQVVARIRRDLAAAIPKRQHVSLAGVEDAPPSHVDLARFHRLWRVACDPMGILDDLNEFALSRDMARGASTLFPLVWGKMRDSIRPVLIERKTVKPTFTLERRRETMLRVLGQIRDVATDALSRDMQAIYAAEAATANAVPAKANRKPGGASSEATTAQRLDAPT
jgi:hypothetical protein